MRADRVENLARATFIAHQPDANGEFRASGAERLDVYPDVASVGRLRFDDAGTPTRR